MLKLAKSTSQRSMFVNIFRLLGCVSYRRRVQILILFIMQLITAALEVVSIGSIIPFLSALTDPQKLMQQEYIAPLVQWLDIQDPQQLIILMALAFSGAIIMANIFRFVTLFGQQFLSAAIAVDLGKMLFSRILHKPYSFFSKSNTSQLIANTTNDLTGALNSLTNFFAVVTQGLIALTVALGLLLYNPKIALLLSGIVVIAYSLIAKAVNHKLRTNSQILADNYHKMIRILQEGFGAIRYIILKSTQKNFTSEFEITNRTFRQKNAYNSVIMQAPKFFMESVGVLAISGIIIAYNAQNKNLADIIPLMGFLVFGCYRLLPAVQQVYFALSSMLSVSASFEKVTDALTAPAPALVSHEAKPLELKQSLRFENVSFSYHEDENRWTLDDINFEIKPKTTIALVGHTGSGKSTLSDLVLGLIQPQKGRITVDGTPITPDNLNAWQAGISDVPQMIFLSDATIAENIAFGIPKKNIDMARVIKAAHMAQLDGFIQTLPGKYNESVGERGIRLSGGQRQRIGIARALYDNPSLIVFDEATSALDNKTEQEVMQAIAGLKDDLTIILIAHRLSTVKKADNILLFEKGKLITQGTYDDLLRNSPNFQELVKSEEMH